MAGKLTKQDKEKIKAYCKLFPKSLHIKVVPCEGTFTIRIKEFPSAITQVEPDVADLIEMVSDCVATILEVPRRYLPFMPQYLPSVKLAQNINAWPIPKVAKRGKLSVVGGCQPAFA